MPPSRKPAKNSRKLKRPKTPTERVGPFIETKGRAGHSFIRNLAMGLFVCFVFFAALEGALRVVGWPSRDPGKDPFVGFSALQPLFVVKNGIASTAPAKLRFFNEASFPVKKGPNTTRVFCFGGSTTYGHPFDGRTAFPRWLQDLLAASCPEKHFEVINAGGVSYASYRLVPLVREALQYNPDLIIISDAHNEFLERRTYSTLFSQGRSLITVRSLLERLHIYQGLKKILEPTLSRVVAQPRNRAAPKTLGTDARQSTAESVRDRQTGKPILHGEVTAILDHSAGLDLYHRDEEFSKEVVRHFTHNLRAMIALCRNAGVPVIMVQPVSNLKDFSPFKSEHSPELTASDKAEYRAQLDRAGKLLQESRYEESLNLIEKALSKDPLYAEAYYYKGKALLGLRRYPEARKSFIKARDLDVCPLRAISSLEQKFDEVAAEEKVTLVPLRDKLEQKLAKTGDKAGIPGNESLLDHVHLMIEVHQWLAEMLFDKMVKMGLARPSRKLASADRQALYDKAMRSLNADFFVTKDMNLAKTLKWAGKKKEARKALARAADKMDDNPEIHKLLGSYLLDDGAYEKALKEYHRAVQLSRDDPKMLFSLATACFQAGSKAEAVSIYRKLVDQNGNMPEAYGNLAGIYLEDGEVGEALNVLKHGMKKSPNSPVLLGQYGLALAMSQRVSEGIPWMLKAIQAEPGDPTLFYNLAGMYSLSGKAADALHYLDLAVQKGYRNPEKVANDPVFQSIRDLPGFKKILNRLR
ncbi:MAG: tetratricopeptide repeat protein [Desulfomonilaceae bacterium]